MTDMLRLSGLATGMDTDMIVAKLMQAQRIPLDKIVQKRTLVEYQRDAFREINTKITNFRNNTLFSFKMEGSFLAKKAETLGNQTAVSAKPTGNAQAGTLILNVNELATAATNRSTASIKLDADFDPDKSLADEIAAGNISGFSSNTFTINGSDAITIEAGDTLNSVISKINKYTNVTAFYDSFSGQVSLVSKSTGKVNGPDGDGDRITFTGDFLTSSLRIETGTAETEEIAATNALIDINGISTERTGNTFTVNGVELTLKEKSAGVSTTFNISSDTDKVVDAVKQFISDYNDILATIQGKIDEPRYRTYLPLTDTQKKDMSDRDIELWEDKAKSGMLKNDTLLQGAISSMRTNIISRVDTGNSSYSTLSSLGIETGQYYENGKLYLNDESKLRAAIEADPDAVKALFTADGTGKSDRSDEGILERMYDDLQSTIDNIKQKAGYPGSLTDNSFLGKQIDDFNDRIDAKERKLSDMEDRYYRQFAAMEAAISRYNQQASYLMNFQPQ